MISRRGAGTLRKAKAKPLSHAELAEDAEKGKNSKDSAKGERPSATDAPGRRIAWMPGQLSVKMSELTFPERCPCRPNAVHWPP
jgi:hypothetical protein